MSGNARISNTWPLLPLLAVVPVNAPPPLLRPLLRLTLIRTASDIWQFVWSVHHLLVDRWSGVQVLSEIKEALGALRRGRLIDAMGVPPVGSLSHDLRPKVRVMRSAEAPSVRLPMSGGGS